MASVWEKPVTEHRLQSWKGLGRLFKQAKLGSKRAGRPANLCFKKQLEVKCLENLCQTSFVLKSLPVLEWSSTRKRCQSPCSTHQLHYFSRNDRGKLVFTFFINEWLERFLLPQL